MTDDSTESHPAETESCDVCIVGAGLAGMNALAVASEYLGRGQRVILVDRRLRVGGMWVDTYPYVRLHQPHPWFTAGDIRWTQGHDRRHLATRSEVLDHFDHCLDVVRRRVTVDTLFGRNFDGFTESGGMVTARVSDADGRTCTITTPRLINAAGFAVTANDALSVRSGQVHSVSPNFCDVDEIASDGAPVWVIGGGKTGMDTAHTLITANPHRQVSMVAGSGTYFLSRDETFPRGRRRWWSGTPASVSGAQMLSRFDGTNEDEANRWFRDTYGVWPTEHADTYVLGIMSAEEGRAIAAGLREVVMDRFADVIDGADGPVMTFTSGESRAVEPGSWIINCTGYVLRDAGPYQPYLSSGGSVLSIQPRSATMHLTSFMAYFMTHMLYRDQLADAPLYEMDAIDLRAKSKVVLPFGILCLSQHNLSVMFERLPNSVFLGCGSNVDSWYPLTRQVRGSLTFLLRHRRDRDSARRTLDTLRERFDLRCGPLATSTGR